VWAETNYGIPTIGTMAHAYVMMHETELDAYINWAKHNPNLGVFLPDTYDAKNGMLKVIEACKRTGTKLKGFRQDSGDLGYLAGWGREQAAKAGFDLSVNNASNDLNATKIAAIELQDGTALDVFSVGTQLGTCAEQPALGGVYKIANIYENGLTNEEIRAMKTAVREGKTKPAEIRDRVRDLMKLSGDAIKMTYPGELDLIRYLDERDGQLFFDGGTVCSEWDVDPLEGIDPNDPFSGTLSRDIMSVVRGNHSLGRTFNRGARAYRPIQRMFTNGQLTGTIENVHEARARTEQRMAMLDPSHKRLVKPHEHVVGVEESLADRQFQMARRLRQTGNTVEANLV
jgi:nicotinate phosphoribosyltransferase